MRPPAAVSLPESPNMESTRYRVYTYRWRRHGDPRPARTAGRRRWIPASPAYSQSRLALRRTDTESATRKAGFVSTSGLRLIDYQVTTSVTSLTPAYSAV